MKFIRFVAVILFCFVLFSCEDGEKIKGREVEFESSKFAIEHVADSHEWHIGDYGGHPISIPLPVVLWDSGPVVFMSSEFEHGHKTVKKKGNYYKIHRDKIYKTDASGTLDIANGKVLNSKPLDFSITKNVTSMFISVIFILWIFIKVSCAYRRSEIPKGLAKFFEPLIIFVRDEIAVPNIGEKRAVFFMPYLLTAFFFIWINNLLGLLPIPPGGVNLTGNISLTLVLSVFTLVLTNVFGNKHYWCHIFDPLGKSFPAVGKLLLYAILIPVEIIGIFTKSFALMIRLFANITAGHIIILSLTALVFVFKTSLVAIATVPFTLFMNLIELLVAFLQAYVFTLLSALFIGLAVKENDHEVAH